MNLEFSAPSSATVKENALSQLNEISRIEHIQPSQQHEQSTLIGDDTVIGVCDVMIGGGTLNGSLNQDYFLIPVLTMYIVKI